MLVRGLIFEGCVGAHVVVKELAPAVDLDGGDSGEGLVEEPSCVAGGSGVSSTAKLRYDLIRMGSMFMDRSPFSVLDDH